MVLQKLIDSLSKAKSKPTSDFRVEPIFITESKIQLYVIDTEGGPQDRERIVVVNHPAVAIYERTGSQIIGLEWCILGKIKETDLLEREPLLLGLC
jgi:hypothetical protein